MSDMISNTFVFLIFVCVLKCLFVLSELCNMLKIEGVLNIDYELSVFKSFFLKEEFEGIVFHKNESGGFFKSEGLHKSHEEYFNKLWSNWLNISLMSINKGR